MNIGRLILLLITIVPIGNGQSETFFGPNCSTAPNPTLTKLCQQVRQWRIDGASNMMPVNPQIASPQGHMGPQGPKVVPMPGSPPMAAALAGPGLSAQCDHLKCLCTNSGGLPSGDICMKDGHSYSMKPALRKEYRILSMNERDNFQKALNKVKSDGTYDVWAGDHVAFRSPAAHGGPAFLPWHREYLKRLEMELRAVDSSVSLPYWDSRLDSPLPDPRDSIMWTPDFMGETDSSGHINTGSFTNWLPTDNDRNGIRRSLGLNGRLFTDSSLNPTFSANDYTSLSNCFNFGNLEYTHGLVHVWVGGHMAPLNLAPNDPAFFMHHSYVDYIWESWRQNQNRWQRENDYPQFTRCSEFQGPNQHMAPFGKNNIDGLSNHYTDRLYNYQPRPVCTLQNQNCNSEFLFCDTLHGLPRCVSKVKMGGRCDSFENQPICFGGFCVRGRCSAMRDSIPTTTLRATTTESICYNRHQCCDWWATIGECTVNPLYMNDACPASCGKCQTRFGLNGECEDNFSQCIKWANENECTKNVDWMAENCRRSCGWCGHQKRCTPTTTTIRPTTTTTILRSTSTLRNNNNNTNDCYNEHRCCQLWADQNECTKNPSYMSSNCAPACGLCTGNFKETEDCVNFHRHCDYWANIGECTNRNMHWMNQNCRKSCATCQLHTSDSITKRCTLPRTNG